MATVVMVFVTFREAKAHNLTLPELQNSYALLFIAYLP
jgi:hypothetical protein